MKTWLREWTVRTWCVCLAALGACASETEGGLVAIDLAVKATPQDGGELATFETATGWTVTLSEARLAVSAIYAYAPADDDRSAVAMLMDLLVPVARAHGGYDAADGRRVRAELLDTVTLDLLDGKRQVLSELLAEAGAVSTFAVEIAPPSKRLDATLHGRQAWVAGEAVRGEERVRFEGGLEVPDEGLARRIEAMTKTLVLEAGGTLELSVRPSLWLDAANFERLAPADGDAPRTITAESQVGRALFIGARNPAAFSVRFIEQEK